MILNEIDKKITNKYLGICYKEHGFKANENLWDGYEIQKSKQLKDLFGDKLIIEKEVIFETPIEIVSANVYKSPLIKLITSSYDEEWQDLINNYPFQYYAYDMSRCEENSVEYNHMKAAQFINKLTNSRTLAKNVVEEDVEIVNPLTFEPIKFQKGARITRILKNFISNKEKLNEIQVLYSQLVNTRKLTGTLCLSIHPLDYLTVSVNQSNWSSCFNSLQKGEYCASTLCLVNSPNTIVAYLKAKDDMTLADCGHEDLVWNNKKWRVLVTLGEDNECIHIGRNYPFESVDLMTSIVNMVEEMSGKKYTGIELSSTKIGIETPENMYNDTLHNNYTVASTDKWYNEHLDQNGNEFSETIEISEGAICPKCGDEYHYHQFDISCEDCYDGYFCEDCGYPIPEDEGYYVEGNGHVCDNCIENYSWCEHCEEYYYYDDVQTVAIALTPSQIKAGMFGGARCYEEGWCVECIDDAIERGDMERCSCCNQATSTSILDENGKCPYCAEE